ncbi:MAG: helix-turn-helix transcriptional regulator [Sedimenticola sp.]
MVKRHICSWLKEAREARGWTQTKLLERLDKIFPEGNWYEEKISRWETCRHRAKDDDIAMLAQVLDESLDVLKEAHDRDHAQGERYIVDALAVCPDAFQDEVERILGQQPAKMLAIEPAHKLNFQHLMSQ